MANLETSDSTKHKQGRLVIVGTGIKAISHMTLETLSHIRRADIVFYHASNGITASQIHELNANAVDLFEYYGEGKKRKITYVQMAELMLRQVRLGLTVVGVFYGHPGYFVSPARRALAIASMEGYETALLPGVSAPDCMFSDLRVDPGVFGCQILMASRILQEDAIIAITGHVVLLQVAAVGDRTFSFSGYKNATLEPFFERLIEIYGEQQESVYYIAAIFPAFEPEIAVRKLLDYRDPEVRQAVKSSMLYLPPKGVTVSSLQSVQSFTNGNPYGDFQSKAVAALDQHETPPEFKLRRASPALYRAMSELGTSVEAQELYRCSPDEFVSRFPDLAWNERAALLSRNLGAVRAVSTFQSGSYSEYTSKVTHQVSTSIEDSTQG
jgi:precorrin-2 methylase